MTIWVITSMAEEWERFFKEVTHIFCCFIKMIWPSILVMKLNIGRIWGHPQFHTLDKYYENTKYKKYLSTRLTRSSTKSTKNQKLQKYKKIQTCKKYLSTCVTKGPSTIWTKIGPSPGIEAVNAYWRGAWGRTPHLVRIIMIIMLIMIIIIITRQSMHMGGEDSHYLWLWWWWWL